jgi:hypothetical protein
MDNTAFWGSQYVDDECAFSDDWLESLDEPSLWPISDETPFECGASVTQTIVPHREHQQLNCSGQRTKKGWGRESKANAPDQHDCYDFEKCSLACIQLRQMGYKSLTLTDIVHIGGKVENLLLAQERPVTERNRAARRRKPNAFHWIDENWPNIDSDMFEKAVLAVLGKPDCPRIRRRHGVKSHMLSIPIKGVFRHFHIQLFRGDSK